MFKLLLSTILLAGSLTVAYADDNTAQGLVVPPTTGEITVHPFQGDSTIPALPNDTKHSIDLAEVVACHASTRTLTVSVQYSFSFDRSDERSHAGTFDIAVGDTFFLMDWVLLGDGDYFPRERTVTLVDYGPHCEPMFNIVALPPFR